MGLDRNIRLLLTNSRSAEGLSLSQQRMQIVLSYMDLDPERRAAVRDFLIEELRQLDTPNPEDKIPEVTPEEIAAFKQQQAAAKEPPNRAISVRLPDLAQSERAQALAKDFDIQAATPEELAQKAATEVALKAASKPEPQKPNGNGNGKHAAPANRN
jgi:hypothetical protein